MGIFIGFAMGALTMWISMKMLTWDRERHQPKESEEEKKKDDVDKGKGTAS